MAAQAEARAAQYAVTQNIERLLREADAATETIILTQAAAEGYVHAALRRSGASCAGGWRTKWAGAPAAICRTEVRALDDATTETLRWLGAWRNFLVHDDDRARSNLARYVDLESAPQQLRAPMAREVISRMDEAFTDLGALVGHCTLAAPHSAALWVAPDEL